MSKEMDPKAAATLTKPRCGIVMPISAVEGCSEKHWADVKEILCDSIQTAGFEPNLVSDADEVGIIQKRIIQNLVMLRRFPSNGQSCFHRQLRLFPFHLTSPWRWKNCRFGARGNARGGLRSRGRAGHGQQHCVSQ
jgi:hypothetical protein